MGSQNTPRHQRRHSPTALGARVLHHRGYDNLQGALRSAGCRPQSVQEVSTDAEILEMVHYGMGVTLLRLSSIPDAARTITGKPISGVSLYEDLGIAWARNNQSRRPEDFIWFAKTQVPDFLSEHCCGERPGSPVKVNHAQER
jgi:DNA-binding transcriptional LysR family regulator